jgi:hypothetical protein
MTCLCASAARLRAGDAGAELVDAADDGTPIELVVVGGGGNSTRCGSSAWPSCRADTLESTYAWKATLSAAA